jgi:FkbM family methyltransferase
MNPLTPRPEIDLDILNQFHCTWWLPSMRRLLRKFKEGISWMGSARKAADFPAALLLSICRTRPPNGPGFYSRCFRRLIPRLCIHPRSLCGFSIAIDPSDMAELIIYEECFVRQVYDLALLPFNPDIVVDCGGFKGYFTLLARARFPGATFVVFEPHPVNYGSMCSNFERNGVDVDARCEAVSNRAGELSFLGSGFGGSLTCSAAEEGSLRVQVTNLCEVITELSPRRLLLKLDVEGEEINILPDLVPLLPPTCGIFFESHHGNEGFENLGAVLQRAGFEVTRGSIRDETFVDAFAIRVEAETYLRIST